MNLESYFITPPHFGVLAPLDFKIALSQVLRTHRPTRACLRANQANDTLLTCFVSLCQEFGTMSYLNLTHLQTSIDKALAHGFVGVHAKAHALLELKDIPPNLQSFYSAHSALEVQEALALGAHFVTLSPIFPTPNKPPSLGLDYLEQLNPAYKRHTFALGGIVHVQQCNLLNSKGIKGFAGMRYFL
ncbi:thiamine phosphate synthase [Helicobacter baculiformis]|uniref:OMP1248 n=1 Tax=Helicobacter baculiformis TaxID=427351 RepID=A0A1M4NGS1_9HELI|nr:thiamine phosphate synthase [Helicobacter baculiformis]SFZ71428.1 OMP1248 [Helicobacter baculiformis]